MNESDCGTEVLRLLFCNNYLHFLKKIVHKLSVTLKNSAQVILHADECTSSTWNHLENVTSTFFKWPPDPHFNANPII